MNPHRSGLKCAGCGTLFDARPTGQVPTYCSRRCRRANDALMRETRRAQEAAYVATPRGRLMRAQAQSRFHASEKGRAADYKVANLMGLRMCDCTPALIEAKREQLTLRRLARQLRKAKDESSTDTR